MLTNWSKVTMSRKRIISGNIKYSAVSQGIVFAINLALFPFIVSHVGKEIYGIYLLVMTFTGYLGVLELGVTAAVTKYVAELTAKDDNEGAAKIVSASLSLYFIIGLVAAAALFSLSFYFDRIFIIEAGNKLLMRQLFWTASAASLFIWPGKIFIRVLDGFQRYDWLAAINIVSATGTGIAAFLMFNRGLGILYFLILSYLFIILKYAGAYIVGRYYLLKSDIIFPYFKKEAFGKIFSFSSFLFLSNLVSLFIFDFDDFIIGSFVSVSAITVYGAGLSLQRGFRAINSLVGSPLFPAGADMEGRSEYAEQKHLLFKGTKYMTMVFIPLVIVAITFAEVFIYNWLGSDFAGGVLPAQILLAFWLFNNTTEVGSGLLVTKGYVKIIFKITALTALLNVGLSLILVKPLGILGVALGTAIPMILVGFPMTLHQILKTFNTSFKEFFDLAIKKNLGVYFFAAFLSITSRWIFWPSNILLTIAQMGAVYAITMGIGFVFFLSPEERKEIVFMIKP